MFYTYFYFAHFSKFSQNCNIKEPISFSSHFLDYADFHILRCHWQPPQLWRNKGHGCGSRS